MDKALLDLLCPIREKTLYLSDKPVTMRVLPAAQLLSIRQALSGETAQTCSAVEGEAMLLSQSLFYQGQPLFPDGAALLRQCSLELVQRLMEEYLALDRERNLSAERAYDEVETLKKA